MKNKIIMKSAELFSNLGFKSVTMDDIANEMGISKKTIYQYFATKTKLVEATAIFKFECISESIDDIFKLEANPIDELFNTKDFIISHMKNQKISIEYQFKKYYPKIYSIVKQKQFEAMNKCVSDNLNRGIHAGLYRTNLNVDFISRIYFSAMGSMKDNEIFPTDQFNLEDSLSHYLEYHLRGICTPKGLDFLNKKTQQSKIQ
ncbi:transcriptional regulator, TetR family [Formosa agariphila KMM 3901]|uniref:Transcriptional regulator, TetR family n=1 Tax=Formosa agariphila (strain DSM 15362 / KCTC 12365 / LMG 23005 / KMM 3901 / M-2Alg 35-1) TaxID=1347342 RepID=T2KIS9_FORAG|nr:TetR/AcrR family transcriptional regulator [Formosa agariphila]CDF77884.1 transcriptional regulator, TetR family [Formosa agariphila KMM 3901]